MRENLKKMKGKRKTFKGVFVRFGTKNGYKGYKQTTVLLKEIISIGNKDICCDHLWFNLTKEFYKLALRTGDVIQFEARVREYHKGYRGYDKERQLEKPIEKDYKLSNPTRIKLVKRQKHQKTMQKDLNAVFQ